jgi:nucleosome-remodeling factor subunit BPTF
MAESKERQVKNLPSTTTEVKFTYTTTALSALNHLISLLKAKEEEVNYESALQSLSTSTKDTKSESLLKKENDIKTESDKSSDIVEIKQENKRIYSDTDTSKPIKLEKISEFEKKQSRIVKYPLAPTFWSKIHAKRNILINSKHELKRLARLSGLISSEGFNYNSKANQSAWPYPCPRPTFKMTWMYRTASMQSLHSVALQLRILWACIR